MKASDIPMSEDKLLRDVIEMATAFGVHTAHFRPAQIRPGKWVTPVQGDGKGWPDLFLVGAGGGFWRETKAEGEYLKPAQKRWFAWLREAGFDVDVWKPRDWRSGRIEQELRAIAKQRAANPTDSHCHVVRDGDTVPCTARPDKPHVDQAGREWGYLTDFTDEATEGCA